MEQVSANQSMVSNDDDVQAEIRAQDFQLTAETRKNRDMRNYMKRFRWIESDDEMFALTTMTAGIDKLNIKLDQLQDIMIRLEFDRTLR
eukprot:747254-Hanusia_phi.AAC.4